MNSSKPNYFNPSFSHIYIEKGIAEHPETERILGHFPRAVRIFIDHYKDVFNRRGQDAHLQHRSQALILARKEPPYFYAGAEVCQDFGNANFYYCSTVRGCIFDCGYCYLKGMYPGGNIVCFVNLEDYFRALAAMLREKNVYLCISYDTDLPALEAVAGDVRRWAEFAKTHENLTIEVRTKSANGLLWELPCLPNVIYAFTLSPQSFIDANERGTPPVLARLGCALAGLKRGYPVRLCFDPMLYQPNWRAAYGELLEEMDAAFAREGLSWKQVKDTSVGCFRISQEYLRKLRKSGAAPAVWFPFVNVDGVYRYPKQLREEMEAYLAAELSQRVGAGRVFCD